MKFLFTFFFTLAGITISHAQSSQANNIVSMQIFNATTIGDELDGYGIGFAYEKLLPNSKKIGIEIPLSFYFRENTSSSYSYNNPNGFFSISPALKIYPFGYDRAVSWSIGPALRFASGDVYLNESFYNNSTGQINYKSNIYSKNYFGTEIQNALNLNVNRLFFNINGSLGVVYNQRGTGILNFSTLVGFKF